MSKRKRSRVRSWPRWVVSTVAGAVTSGFVAATSVAVFGATVLEAAMMAAPCLALIAVGGMVSTLFEGFLTTLLEGLSVVVMVVLAPLALLNSCG